MNFQRAQCPAFAPDVRPRRASSTPSVVVVHGALELERYAERLEELARHAIEPNVFYEPWVLLPALRLLPETRRLDLALVSRRDGTLVGFFPLVRLSRYHSLPVATLTLWSHERCPLSTPLVHAGHARECMDAFFDWLRDHSRAMLIELGGISGDGPFQHALDEALDARGETFWLVSRRTRALYARRESIEAYLAAAMGSEARRRLRARERRLRELGRVEYAELGPEGEVDDWTEEFLALEARGWRGRAGSAAAMGPARRRFFEAVVGEAFVRGRLEMLALRVDERALAIKCNLLAGEGSFAFGAAWDERYARLSPGVLLEVDCVRRLHARRDGVRWLDSCGAPEARPLGGLGVDRRTIETVLVAAGREPGRLFVSLMPLALWVSRHVREVREWRRSAATGHKP